MKFLVFLISASVVLSCTRANVKSMRKPLAEKEHNPETQTPGSNSNEGGSSNKKTSSDQDNNSPMNTVKKLTMGSTCVDPDLTKLLNTQWITLCNGTKVQGQLAISPQDIKNGVTLAGIAGSYTAQSLMKQCRNAADLSTYDAPSLSNLPSLAHAENNWWPHLNQTAGNIDTGSDEINFDPSYWSLKNGTAVQFSSDDTLPGGITAATPYYVIVSGNKIKLATSEATALAGTPVVDISSIGAGNFFMGYANSNAVADLWDTIDDYNNGEANAPNASPWGPEHICDESNFTSVSGSTASLTPSNTTPSNATAAFSQIWRDDLTGLHFSNILYDGNPSTVNWAGGMEMCSGLDSGDGTGEWRMPTQKELLQLYVNGIAKLNVAGGNLIDIGMWSSSLVSGYSNYARVVSLAYGWSNYTSRNYAGYGVVCVR